MSTRTTKPDPDREKGSVTGLIGRRFRCGRTGAVFAVADADGLMVRVTTAADPWGEWRRWEFLLGDGMTELLGGGA